MKRNETMCPLSPSSHALDCSSHAIDVTAGAEVIAEFALLPLG
jgi:hypothetical protein